MVGRDQVYAKVREMILAAFSGTGHVPHVSLCKETHEVRKTTGMCNANCTVCRRRHPRSATLRLSEAQCEADA